MYLDRQYSREMGRVIARVGDNLRISALLYVNPFIGCSWKGHPEIILYLGANLHCPGPSQDKVFWSNPGRCYD